MQNPKWVGVSYLGSIQTGKQVNTDRLIITDGVDLCSKHDSCKCEEEDGFKAEEDQQQHGHPRREVAALCSETDKNLLLLLLFKGAAHVCSTQTIRSQHQKETINGTNKINERLHISCSAEPREEQRRQEPVLL